MLIGELAREAGVTIRALRYYEKAGLLTPARSANGYRHYDEVALRQVAQIRELTALGLSVEETRPFVECLAGGHDSADECPASLAAYRAAIDALSTRIARLTRWRDELAGHLDSAATRSFPGPYPHIDLPPVPAPEAACQFTPHVPEPVPASRDSSGPSTSPGTPDEAEAPDELVRRLTGRPVPALTFPDTGGGTVDLTGLGEGRSVVYLYPLSGRPGVDLPDGWDTIPGARGCTAQACAFRDHHQDLRAAGATHVYGLSTQNTEYQRELVDRLHLPFAMLSDEAFGLRDALGLPTFEAGGRPLLRRLTLILRGSRIEHVFYPVDPPADHATQVLTWLRGRP
ncbi:MerR family transcriptional regulator [Actinoplanes rectilineatus]|uniref:MerR family transcriptional regulator n=1 Tax=Actinoplanes rectilineatus TaxID=113571 RepID=UPI0005F2A406|nr:MerR family transcriptional regulator [Actinoplanes rectilineatus]